jgi:hypothetical protein
MEKRIVGYQQDEELHWMAERVRTPSASSSSATMDKPPVGHYT